VSNVIFGGFGRFGISVNNLRSAFGSVVYGNFGSLAGSDFFAMPMSYQQLIASCGASSF
jgi:hypothetical protein